MHLVFLAVRIFPFWAIPVALVFGQLGNHFMRKHSPMRFACWGITVGLIFTAGAWVFFRGDLYADLWVKRFFEL